MFAFASLYDGEKDLVIYKFERFILTYKEILKERIQYIVNRPDQIDVIKCEEGIMKNVKILVGTPAYGAMLHMDYHNTIMSLHANGINFDNMIIGNESLVTRGRNKIISYFHYSDLYSHLLFLDADMGLPPYAVPTMLQRNKDVIGLPVALKGFDNDGNNVLNTGKIFGEENDLVKVEKVGTAVFMLSKKAVKDLINSSESYKENPYYTRGKKIYNDVHDVFRVGIVDNGYLSEDYWVCRTLRKLGYDIYVDPTIPTKHNGNFEFVFEGNKNLRERRNL